MIFERPFRIFFLVQRILTTFTALLLDFPAKKRRFAVLGIISNMFVNKHIYVLALGFLTGVDVIFTLGLLSVTPYGADSRAASKTSLRFFLSSLLPAC